MLFIGHFSASPKDFLLALEYIYHSFSGLEVGGRSTTTNTKPLFY